ncbi:hypothetical protein CEXT_174761 [Caerostris extrusa]|uniref:Uncharacterized protein n=1 Tax=Caerostris extrusa TaxID=172846 RepID=A0AAV4XG33_CAEEX|nr:hypothetical protein CEXT_174761 [Caerostris extrusa]
MRPQMQSRPRGVPKEKVLEKKDAPVRSFDTFSSHILFRCRLRNERHNHCESTQGFRKDTCRFEYTKQIRQQVRSDLFCHQDGIERGKSVNETANDRPPCPRFESNSDPLPEEGKREINLFSPSTSNINTGRKEVVHFFCFEPVLSRRFLFPKKPEQQQVLTVPLRDLHIGDSLRFAYLQVCLQERQRANSSF